MELSRTEYPSLLTALQPTPAVAILRERLRKGQLLNTEVADWLQERRKVEESYVQGLLRLTRKQPPGDLSELGIFRSAWGRIVNATSQLAESHLHLAQKIDSEVERPLREFAIVNKDWTGLKTCDENLASLAKQIDSAKDKADKLQRKGTRAQASKVAEAEAAVKKTTGDWESQAPFIFEKFQAADETRCNTLRDCLTQYHTLEVDQAQRSIQLANGSLSTLLDLNTSDEIKTFAETVTHGKPKIERQGGKAPTTASAGMPSSTPFIVTDDSVSVQSAGSGSGGGSGLGHGLGLRRLGTVLRGRNRNSSVPYMRPSSPIQSSERLSFKKEGVASPRSPDFATASSQNLSIPALSVVEPTQPSSPKTNGLESQGSQQNGFRSPPSADPLQPLLVPTLSVTEEPQKDAEGFTIPPPVTGIGGVPLEDSTEPAPPQFKVEIKNDVIPEEEEEAGAAMSKVASHLRMCSQQNTAPRKNRGRRDARDVRNTIFLSTGAGSPEPLEMLNSSSPPLTPLKVPRMTPAVPSEPSDTQSVRSSRSVTSFTGGALLRHPELHERGLSSSLVESVNVSFESEKPIKVAVIGEIALAYNLGTEVLSPQTSQIVRVDNYALFEKIATNPAFLSPVSDKAGEYSIFLPHLHKTTVAFKYQLHLEETSWSEYLPMIISPMWRVEPHQASVILTYKPNPNYRQSTSVDKPITLRNITFITGVDGAVPASCQSKPVGTFSREMGRIAWKIGDLTLGSTSGTGKLVARFLIDAGAGVGVKPVPSEMKWEIVGDEAVKAGSPLGLSTLESVEEASEEVNPFADEESMSKSGKSRTPWREVGMVKRIISGKYYGL